jgi:membrane-associated phospholipid phosphatase
MALGQACREETRRMQHHSLQVGMVALVVLTASWGWTAVTHARQAPEEFPAEVASIWFDTLYELVKTEQLTPPVAARIYAVVAVALYEAIVPGSGQQRSLVGQLNELVAVPQPRPHTWYHWPTVANATLARAVRGLFPTASSDAVATLTALEHHVARTVQTGLPASVSTRSVTQGYAVADAVLAWAATDDWSTVAHCAYTPPEGPGLWEPTPPAFTPTPLLPCWGQVRSFVLTSGEECAPPPPPAYSEDPASAFYAFALEVYRVTRTLTEEQRTIAQYWADNTGATGTPSGHWIAIVGQLARTQDLSLMAAAEAYARVGLTVADAFIGSWQTKYTYNLLRPVTYIQAVIDPTWMPLLITPSFPSYTSGHAVQSGAAAVVLTDMFGVITFTDTLFTDHALMPRQAPRTFASFEEAAEEAAISRFYAGIHYPFDSSQGLAQGTCIGTVIIDRVQFSHSTEPHKRDR